MNNKALGQIALILTLGLLSVLLYLRNSNRQKIDLNPYQALGTVAGAETSRLLRNQGEVVVVLPDPGSERDPAMDAQLAAYKAGLKNGGKVVVRNIETVKMDPFLSMRTGGAMPPDQFLSLLKKFPSVSAFVLFIAFPAPSEPELAESKMHPGKKV